MGSRSTGIAVASRGTYFMSFVRQEWMEGGGGGMSSFGRSYRGRTSMDRRIQLTDIASPKRRLPKYVLSTLRASSLLVVRCSLCN